MMIWSTENPGKTSLRTFEERLKDKPRHLQRRILKAIRLLANNPKHPGLQTHKVHGVSSNGPVFEAYVDMSNRLTFHYGEEGVIVLRNHCNHDIVRRSP